jgi:PleD family two-component response regulator
VWFAQAMTRVLAPIREDLAELNEKTARLTTDLNTLTDKVTGLDNRLKMVQSSNAQIRRMAAIVGLHFFLSLVIH